MLRWLLGNPIKTSIYGVPAPPSDPKIFFWFQYLHICDSRGICLCEMAFNLSRLILFWLLYQARVGLPWGKMSKLWYIISIIFAYVILEAYAFVKWRLIHPDWFYFGCHTKPKLGYHGAKCPNYDPKLKLTDSNHSHIIWCNWGCGKHGLGIIFS